jgi:hypothetical protein
MLLITDRPWREIARELANENDPERIFELCEELTRAVYTQRSVPEREQEKRPSHAA